MAATPTQLYSTGRQTGHRLLAYKRDKIILVEINYDLEFTYSPQQKSKRPKPNGLVHNEYGQYLMIFDATGRTRRQHLKFYSTGLRNGVDGTR